jgi:Tfp pilus assembly protein PilX
MVIMMVMLVITYFLADALFSEMAIANNQKAATLSFHLAEAGTQEAVWRVQNDTATRNTFLNTTAGVTTFSHNGALLNGGSYTVTIQNTAKGAATITATGLYTFGLKQAQRVITLNVYQTTSPAPYTLDGVLMVGGPNPGDINLTNTTISQDSGYDPSSIIGGGNIFATNATINLTKDYLSDKQISFTNANLTAAGNVLSNQNLSSKNSNVKGATVQGNYNPPLPAYNLPMVDVTSSCATNLNSYKCLAQSQGQYYNSSQTYKNQSNLTFNGITYVAGSVTFTNVSNLTINGILVAEGSISFTNVSNLTVNHTTGPSGLITLQNLNTTNFTGVVNGLVYVGVQAGVAVNTNLTINGALLAHSFSATNATLKLNFNKDWVNEALQPGATNSPVIQFQHWEEEY